MFGNVRLVFGTILENLRKSSEGGRKSLENHQKRRHQHVYIIKSTLHGGLKMWILFSRGKTIFYSLAALVRKILFLPRENKIHIFKPPCNVLFIIWRNQFNKSKRRESWHHWTIRHSQRWHTENTPLGSRMKWRMESTSGLVPSKTLSSV